MDLSKLFHDSMDQIEHTSTVKSFYNRFEVVRPLIQSLNPEIPEEYFASRFVLGLQDEFQNFIFKFHPKTVIAAYRLALIFEESIYLEYFPEIELLNDEICGSSNVKYHSVANNVVNEELVEDFSSNLVNSVNDEEFMGDETMAEVDTSILPVLSVNNEVENQLYTTSISSLDGSTVPSLDKKEVILVEENENSEPDLFSHYQDSHIISVPSVDMVTFWTSAMIVNLPVTGDFIEQVEVPIAWDFSLLNNLLSDVSHALGSCNTNRYEGQSGGGILILSQEDSATFACSISDYGSQNVGEYHYNQLYDMVFGTQGNVRSFMCFDPGITLTVASVCKGFQHNTAKIICMPQWLFQRTGIAGGSEVPVQGNCNSTVHVFSTRLVTAAAPGSQLGHPVFCQAVPKIYSKCIAGRPLRLYLFVQPEFGPQVWLQSAYYSNSILLSASAMDMLPCKNNSARNEDFTKIVVIMASWIALEEWPPPYIGSHYNVFPSLHTTFNNDSPTFCSQQVSHDFSDASVFCSGGVKSLWFKLLCNTTIRILAFESVLYRMLLFTCDSNLGTQLQTFCTGWFIKSSVISNSIHSFSDDEYTQISNELLPRLAIVDACCLNALWTTVCCSTIICTSLTSCLQQSVRGYKMNSKSLKDEIQMDIKSIQLEELYMHYAKSDKSWEFFKYFAVWIKGWGSYNFRVGNQDTWHIAWNTKLRFLVSWTSLQDNQSPFLTVSPGSSQAVRRIQVLLITELCLESAKEGQQSQESHENLQLHDVVTSQGLQAWGFDSGIKLTLGRTINVGFSPMTKQHGWTIDSLYLLSVQLPKQSVQLHSQIGINKRMSERVGILLVFEVNLLLSPMYTDHLAVSRSAIYICDLGVICSSGLKCQTSFYMIAGVSTIAVSLLAVKGRDKVCPTMFYSLAPTNLQATYPTSVQGTFCWWRDAPNFSVSLYMLFHTPSVLVLSIGPHGICHSFIFCSAVTLWMIAWSAKLLP